MKFKINDIIIGSGTRYKGEEELYNIGIIVNITNLKTHWPYLKGDSRAVIRNEPCYYIYWFKCFEPKVVCARIPTWKPENDRKMEPQTISLLTANYVDQGYRLWDWRFDHKGASISNFF